MTHDLHSCVSSALVNAVSFLKWLHSDQTPLKRFPVRKRCNVTAPGWWAHHAPRALLTWGKAASAGKFLERCSPTAIPTYPRTGDLQQEIYPRHVATSSSGCSLYKEEAALSPSPFSSTSIPALSSPYLHFPPG